MQETLKRFDSYDRQAHRSLSEWRRPWLNKAFELLTRTGTAKAWLIFAGLTNLLDFQHIHFVSDQRGFMRAMLAPLLSWLVGTGLKRVFSRQRPYEACVAMPTCGSFPSTHTSGSIAFFAALILAGHPLAPVVGAWAILVSFSRLYLGVHYVSDVLGGAVLGILSAIAVQQVF